VFDKEAGVLNHEEAGGVGFRGGFGVGNSLLEPESFSVDGDGRVGYGRDVFRAAEDVDDVDGEWNVFEAGIGFFAENFGFVGIDGNDLVADGLQVGSDLVGGAAGIGGEPDDGDGFRVAEEIADGIGGIRQVVRKVEEHECWMNRNGKRVNEKIQVEQ
jgi:hypothetical protein